MLALVPLQVPTQDLHGQQTAEQKLALRTAYIPLSNWTELVENSTPLAAQRAQWLQLLALLEHRVDLWHCWGQLLGGWMLHVPGGEYLYSCERGARFLKVAPALMMGLDGLSLHQSLSLHHLNHRRHQIHRRQSRLPLEAEGHLCLELE